MQRKVARDLVQEGNVVVTNLSKIAEAYSGMIESSEMVGRLRELNQSYDYAKNDLGYSDTDAKIYAAFQARDLLDFARSGLFIGDVLSPIIPFLNPSVQGKSRTIRSIKENPLRFAGRSFVFAVIPLMLTRALWKMFDREDEYEQKSPYEKDMFWNIPIPGYKGSIYIPKDYEMAMFSALTDRAYSLFTADDKVEAARAKQGLGALVMNSVSPFDIPSLLGPFRYLVESYSNYDFFRDRFIIPPYEQPLRPEHRPKKSLERGSRLGQVLYGVSGWDPRKWDHFIKGQFTYAGRAAIEASDLGRDDKPYANLQNFVLRNLTGLFRNPPGYNAADVQWVLNEAKETGKMDSTKYLRNKLSQAINEEDPEKAEKARKDAMAEAKRLRALWQE